MSVILKRYKGESTTFGFVLPDDYDLANLEDVKVYIGSNVYPHTMDNVRTVKAKLTSEDTQGLTGRNSVIFHIDDAVFGIRKILVGEFQVDTSCDTFRDDSVNTGYDVLVMLKVEIDTIAIDAVLYDVAKGDKGDKGDNAFVVWQSQAGNEGKTEQDFFDFLQEPANEAIQQVLETEGEIIAAEGLRVIAEQGRFNAEVLRADAEVLRIAQYGLSQQATQDANDAADLANEKAGIANQAAIDANEAVSGMAGEFALKENLTNKKSVINPTSTDEYPNSKAVADVIIPAEQVTAESLTVLNRRIEALENILANSQYSKIDVLDEFNIFGKTNLILFGVTSPSITPDFIGQFYINTTDGITYQSKGVTNSGDWKQTSN